LLHHPGDPGGQGDGSLRLLLAKRKALPFWEVVETIKRMEAKREIH